MFAGLFVLQVAPFLLRLHGQKSAFLLQLLVLLILDHSVCHLSHLGLDLVQTCFELGLALALQAFLVLHHLLDDALVLQPHLFALLLGEHESALVLLENFLLLGAGVQAFLHDLFVLIPNLLVDLLDLPAVLLELLLRLMPQ